jgi:hypothetical protein
MKTTRIKLTNTQELVILNAPINKELVTMLWFGILAQHGILATEIVSRKKEANKTSSTWTIEYNG